MGKVLTKKEELILLAVLNLKQNAYLVAIQHHLKVKAGRDILLTAVHLPLSKLEQRGLISSELGEAKAIRGGRRKRVYSLTHEGFQTLAECKRINDVMWAGFSEIGLE